MPTLKDETLPHLSQLDRARLAGGGMKRAEGFECFNCGCACKYGELSCPRCQTMFASGGRTRKLKDEVTVYQQDRKRSTGEVFVEPNQSITLHINGASMALPASMSLIIGRASDIPGDVQPDIDLNPFRAGEYGVSRHHVKISRGRESAQVTDLGSSNGTFLNGRPIGANTTRLLRNGDEIQLGHLKVNVTFG